MSYWSQGQCEIHLGDSLVVAAQFSPDSIDACVTDPPYETGFMAKKWDKSGIANSVELWRQVYRVLKPGAHLLSFGGNRTHHRMVCAIEDAGFEIRDEIDWLYGQGFPKSLNFDDGWGTALKPAKEPICLARKPFDGTVEANRAVNGTGAMNVNGCRVGWHSDADKASGHPQGKYPSAHDGFEGKSFAMADRSDRSPFDEQSPLGRWPANVIHDGSEEVLAAFPDAKGQLAAARTDGTLKSSAIFGAMNHSSQPHPPRVDDTQSAARFFYCAKTSKQDREDGCELLAYHTAAEMVDREPDSAGMDSPRAGAGRTAGRKNFHPTVKPTALMRYLCRLITPPGGLIYDPFLGSGSTGKAAALEGFRFIGSEIDEGYCKIAAARIGKYAQTTLEVEFA